MLDTPKSMKLQIAVTGRTNAGKSSLINYICNQEVAITSPVAGTTTDVVEKAMELRPLGPVVWLDTAGTDDCGTLGNKRIERTFKAIDRADILILVTKPGIWGQPEEELLKSAEARKIKVLPVITHTDTVDEKFKELITSRCGIMPLAADCTDDSAPIRNAFIDKLTSSLLELLPADLIHEPPLLADLISPQDTVLMLVPIDLQAPKGRLILPQVQAIRDALDAQSSIIVVKEDNYVPMLNNLKTPPSLAVCDSQVVDFMVKNTPSDIRCTTFSILLSRLKSDIVTLAAGAAKIKQLTNGSRILISESCTHHASDNDIGRVKIPALLKKFTGCELDIQVIARDFPEDLENYDLIIQCGSCMLNRRESLNRLNRCMQSKVPVTNYGMAISLCQGVLERVLTPFPEALAEFNQALCH